MKKKSFWDFMNINKGKKKKTGEKDGVLFEATDKLLGTISKYFTTEPEKERVLRNEDFDAAGDTYYATVSARYKVCQRIFFTIFVVLATFSLLLNIKNITYNNFFFLIQDLGAAAEAGDYNYSTLSYDASSEQSFTLYRGGLAVVSRSNVSAFTSTGRRTLMINSVYSKPYAVASDKYLLVYDMGGTSFAIYNSFAKVYSEKLEYPITKAVFLKDGSFVILTRSEKYESVVHHYSDGFKRIASYSKNLYAIDISASEDCKRLGVVYVDTNKGIVETNVTFYDLKNHKKLNEHTVTEEFPLDCSFMEGGELSVTTDSSVILFNRRAESYEVLSKYPSKTVSALWSDDKYIAVAHNNGIITDICDIIVFDKNGNLVYNETVPSSVEQLCVNSGYVFIKNSSEVMRIKIKDSSVKRIASQDGRMLVDGPNTVLVCAQSKAECLDFKN